MFGFSSLPIDFDVQTKRMGGSNKILIVSYDGKDQDVDLKRFEQAGMSRVRIGRAADNELRIQSSVVADYQATLVREGADYYLYDGQDRQQAGRYQPSDNGLIYNGQPIKDRKKLANGDIIKIRRGFYTVNLAYYDLASRDTVPTVALDKQMTIGRNSLADLRLNYLDVSNYHARISPTKKGHTLEDLDSTNGTYLDGRRLKSGQKVTLKSGQQIKIAQLEFVYTGQHLQPVGTIATSGSQHGYRLDGIGLKKQVPADKNVTTPQKQSQWVDQGKKAILDDISLMIQPKEFVALVGGSGAGKSTLLDALNASRPVDDGFGRVLVNGEDLYANFDKYRREIGYVPQKDIIHENLKVEQVLWYAALLRGIPHSKISDSIKNVLDKVSMTDHRRTLVKSLSGGQKKRVSIAVELIAEPHILFLDEPTSGLDPGLDKAMMELLRKEIATNEGNTVVLVTHATENITRCHLVAFLAKGGRLAFYGKPAEALQHFKVKTFSDIYELVDNEPDKWVQTFRQSAHYQQNVQKRLAEPQPPASLKMLPPPAASGCGAIFAPVIALWEQTWRRLEPLRQMVILSMRYGATMLADKARVVGLALGAPLMAAMVLAFTIELNIFAEGDPEQIHDIHVALFTLSCIACFFGLFSSIQEISKERHIYDREQLANLNIVSYVCSKVFLLSLISLVQAFIVIYGLGLWAGFPDEGASFLPPSLELVITIFLTLLAAVNLGLMISAAVKYDQDRTLNILAILVIIQIVFSGAQFELSGIWQILTGLTLTRWSIEAMGATLHLNEMVETIQRFQPNYHLPLTYGGGWQLLKNWVILLLYAGLFFSGTIWILQRQDITRALRQRYRKLKK